MKSREWTKEETTEFFARIEAMANQMHRNRDWWIHQHDFQTAQGYDHDLAKFVKTMKALGITMEWAMEKECATCDPFVCYHIVEYKGVQKDEN